MSTPLREAPPAEADQGSVDLGLPREGAVSAWGWTRGNRITIAVLTGLLVVLMAIGYLRRPVVRDGGIVVTHDGTPVLETRIDPNTADAASLERIPRMSRRQAEAIVAYRESHRSAAAAAVFRRAEDLDAVPGFGSKLAAEFGAFMTFPEGEQATNAHGLVPPRRLPSVDE